MHCCYSASRYLRDNFNLFFVLQQVVNNFVEDDFLNVLNIKEKSQHIGGE